LASFLTARLSLQRPLLLLLLLLLLQLLLLMPLQ